MFQGRRRRRAALGSTSAGMFTQLRLTGPIVKETCALVKDNKSAQVSSTGVLRTTTFKLFHQEALLEVECPLCLTGVDSFNHVLRFFSMENREAKWPEATHVKTDSPGVVPRCSDVTAIKAPLQKIWKIWSREIQSFYCGRLGEGRRNAVRMPFLANEANHQ